MALAKEVKVEVLDGDSMPERNAEMVKQLIRKVAMRKLRRGHPRITKEAA
jgi:hypothetical protein